MKKALLILLVFLLILSPVLMLTGVILLVPSQYSSTFVGELDEKYDRLMSLEQSKVVVVGGSSVAFGLDSALLEKYVGMPVVNFGLYAALGTKLMLDLSLPGIREGDIVILAPELDAQTLSLYFSSEHTWQAIDGAPGMLRHIGRDNWLSMLGGAWRFATSKLAFAMGETPDPSGVYNGRNFNEYGDLVYDRPHNTMPMAYDPNTVISLHKSVIAGDFLTYLNDYVDACQARGATVYFSYCPMNSMALEQGTTDKSVAAFDAYLRDSLRCPVISTITDYIMDPGYFYDTNFHCNDVGARYRTVQLTRDLLLAMGRAVFVEETLPAPAPLPEQDVRYTGYDANEVYFTYEAMENGALRITGLTEEGRRQTRLTVPLGAGSYRVLVIGADALAGSDVQQLIIPADSYVSLLETHMLRGSSCQRVDIAIDNPESVKPPETFGAVSGLQIHTPAISDYSYAFDYTWLSFWAANPDVRHVADLG